MAIPIAPDARRLLIAADNAQPFNWVVSARFPSEDPILGVVMVAGEEPAGRTPGFVHGLPWGGHSTGVG